MEDSQFYRSQILANSRFHFAQPLELITLCQNSTWTAMIVPSPPGISETAVLAQAVSANSREDALRGLLDKVEKMVGGAAWGNCGVNRQRMADSGANPVLEKLRRKLCGIGERLEKMERAGSHGDESSNLEDRLTLLDTRVGLLEMGMDKLDHRQNGERFDTQLDRMEELLKEMEKGKKTAQMSGDGVLGSRGYSAPAAGSLFGPDKVAASAKGNGFSSRPLAKSTSSTSQGLFSVPTLVAPPGLNAAPVTPALFTTSITPSSSTSSEINTGSGTSYPLASATPLTSSLFGTAGGFTTSPAASGGPFGTIPADAKPSIFSTTSGTFGSGPSIGSLFGGTKSTSGFSSSPLGTVDNLQQAARIYKDLGSAITGLSELLLLSRA